MNDDLQKDKWHTTTMDVLSGMMREFSKTYGTPAPEGFSALATVMVQVTTDGQARIVSIRRLGMDVVGP